MGIIRVIVEFFNKNQLTSKILEIDFVLLLCALLLTYVKDKELKRQPMTSFDRQVQELGELM